MTVGYRERILIVEDEEKLARLMQQLLEAFGYEVQIMGRGTEAIAYAAEHRPDLVILDLRLPDLNGYEVCRRLRQRYHPSVMPVLMVTAMNEPVDQLRGLASGADAYLTKPYDSTELVKTVITLLEQPSADSAVQAG